MALVHSSNPFYQKARGYTVDQCVYALNDISEARHALRDSASSGYLAKLDAEEGAMLDRLSDLRIVRTVRRASRKEAA